MSGEFSTKENSLIFELDGKQETYKLPYHESELVGVKAFVNDLNRRALKLELTAGMIKVNEFYVFIKARKTIKIKFPDVKGRHIDVDEKTHTMAKTQAARAGIPMKKYVKLCLIQCKSGLKDTK